MSIQPSKRGNLRQTSRQDAELAAAAGRTVWVRPRTWPAFRLTTTILLSTGSAIEAWTVSQADLDAALAADRGPEAS